MPGRPPLSTELLCTRVVCGVAANMRFWVACLALCVRASGVAVPAPTPYKPIVVIEPQAGVYAYDLGVRVEWRTFGDLENCGNVEVLL